MAMRATPLSKMLLVGVTAVVAVSVSAAPYEPRPDYAAAISNLQTLPSQFDHQRDPAAWRRRELEHFRRQDIARQILSYLKLPCLPQPPAISVNSRRLLSRLTGLVQNRTSPGHRDRLHRAQSLPPSCDGPMIIAENEIRASVPSLRIYFNLSMFFPTVPEHATIEAAELRLYKKSGSPAIRLDTDPEEMLTVQVAMDAPSDVSATDAAENVTWPVSSEAVAVPMSVSDWLRVDVRETVLAWQRGAENLGFLVALQDENGQQLDPRQHIQDFNCDGDIPNSPMPGYLMEAAEFQHMPLLSDGLYPLLDLQTSEPTGDAIVAATGAQLPTPVPCDRLPSASGASPGGVQKQPQPQPRHTGRGYRAFAPLDTQEAASGVSRGRLRRRPRPQNRSSSSSGAA